MVCLILYESFYLEKNISFRVKQRIMFDIQDANTQFMLEVMKILYLYIYENRLVDQMAETPST